MMALQTAAKLLGGEVSGGQIRCPGPGHTPKDRSVSVKLLDGDDFIVNSFGRSDALQCKDMVREKLGIKAFEPGKKDAEPRPRKEVNRTCFEYRDPQTGKVPYSKTRLDFDDKTKELYFAPKGRGGSEPLLYGGERVKQRPAVQWVWIVEGEKKVDRIAELGMLAVSGDTGESSKWLPAHAELLRGRQIILWPDSDEPGEKYIANAAAAIRAEDPGADIRVVRPFGPPNGSKGKEVCDWQGDAADLVALSESAEPYQPTGEPAPVASCSPDLDGVYFDGDAPPAPVPMLIERLLPLEGLTIISGQS